MPSYRSRRADRVLSHLTSGEKIVRFPLLSSRGPKSRRRDQNVGLMDIDPPRDKVTD